MTDETLGVQREAVARSGGGGARVLVIDDEPEIRRAVRAGLAGAHYMLEWAATGAEGLEAIARWHPDVVILDLTLPDGDGLDVLRAFRTW